MSAPNYKYVSQSTFYNAKSSQQSLIYYGIYICTTIISPNIYLPSVSCTWERLEQLRIHKSLTHRPCLEASKLMEWPSGLIGNHSLITGRPSIFWPRKFQIREMSLRFPGAGMGEGTGTSCFYLTPSYLNFCLKQKKCCCIPKCLNALNSLKSKMRY